jgi:hypothetical protein
MSSAFVIAGVSGATSRAAAAERVKSPVVEKVTTPPARRLVIRTCA